MSKLSEILRVAQLRGQESNLPYEGALLPMEAHEVLNASTGSFLVDVRTHAEIDWVGFIPGAHHIEWQSYPHSLLNEAFLTRLKMRVPEDALLMFICRSGVRSHAAATLATASGWGSCYNVLHGFEGDRNSLGQRNGVNGWRAIGLPWKQN